MARCHGAVGQADCPVLHFLNLILEMLRRWNIADLHTAVTCDSIARTHTYIFLTASIKQSTPMCVCVRYTMMVVIWNRLLK